MNKKIKHGLNFSFLFISSCILFPSSLLSQTYSFSKFDLPQHLLSANVLGLSFTDYNNDNKVDLYVAGRSGANMLLQNNGDLNFTDVAPQFGIDDNSQSRVGVWADYNNDGFADLFLANINSCKFFINNASNSFTENTEHAGLYINGFTNSILWADVDHDQFVDLYSANFGATNSLFMNNGDGSFTDRVHASRTNDSNQLAMGGVFGDYDNDGDLDLYLVHDGFQRFVLYRNTGYGTFQEVSSHAGVNYRGMGMGAVFADFDNDGLLDIYITNLDDNAIFFNNGNGTFELTTETSGVGDIGMAWGVVALDYDNDTFLDIYVVNTSTFHSPSLDNVLYRNLGDRTFEIVTVAAGVSSFLDGYSGVAGDINDDGYQDLIVSNQNSEGIEIFLNNGGLNNYIKVDLTGTISNRYAIGTRVRIVSENGQQIREVSGGSGYLSQDSPVLHFGLAQATAVDTLEIYWPNSTVERYFDLAVNKTYHFTEGTTTEVTEISQHVPQTIRLHPVYPNPLLKSSNQQHFTLEFEVPSMQNGPIILSIYDLRGRQINQLVNQTFSAGLHKIKWNGDNRFGLNVPAGIYFARIQANHHVATQKIVIIR